MEAIKTGFIFIGLFVVLTALHYAMLENPTNAAIPQVYFGLIGIIVMLLTLWTLSVVLQSLEKLKQKKVV